MTAEVAEKAGNMGQHILRPKEQRGDQRPDAEAGQWHPREQHALEIHQPEPPPHVHQDPQLRTPLSGRLPAGGADREVVVSHVSDEEEVGPVQRQRQGLQSHRRLRQALQNRVAEVGVVQADVPERREAADLLQEGQELHHVDVLHEEVPELQRGQTAAGGLVAAGPRTPAVKGQRLQHPGPVLSAHLAAGQVHPFQPLVASEGGAQGANHPHPVTGDAVERRLEELQPRAGERLEPYASRLGVEELLHRQRDDPGVLHHRHADLQLQVAEVSSQTVQVAGGAPAFRFILSAELEAPMPPQLRRAEHLVPFATRQARVAAVDIRQVMENAAQQLRRQRLPLGRATTPSFGPRPRLHASSSRLFFVASYRTVSWRHNV